MEILLTQCEEGGHENSKKLITEGISDLIFFKKQQRLEPSKKELAAIFIICKPLW